MAARNHCPATRGITELPGREEGARTVTRAGGEASPALSPTHSFVGPLGDAEGRFKDTGQPGRHCGLKNKRVGPSPSRVTHLMLMLLSAVVVSSATTTKPPRPAAEMAEMGLPHSEAGRPDKGGSRRVSPRPLPWACRLRLLPVSSCSRAWVPTSLASVSRSPRIRTPGVWDQDPP